MFSLMQMAGKIWLITKSNKTKTNIYINFFKQPDKLWKFVHNKYTENDESIVQI